MAADIPEQDPRHDLAAFQVNDAQAAPFQLWAGEVQQVTDAGVSTGVLPKYSLCALMPDNTVVLFVPGTHLPAQMVINAQPTTATGQAVPYWDQGKFNHKAINFPAAWDQYNERKTGLLGSNLRVGHLI